MVGNILPFHVIKPNTQYGLVDTGGGGDWTTLAACWADIAFDPRPWIVHCNGTFTEKFNLVNGISAPGMLKGHNKHFEKLPGGTFVIDGEATRNGCIYIENGLDNIGFRGVAMTDSTGTAFSNTSFNRQDRKSRGILLQDAYVNAVPQSGIYIEANSALIEDITGVDIATDGDHLRHLLYTTGNDIIVRRVSGTGVVGGAVWRFYGHNIYGQSIECIASNKGVAIANNSGTSTSGVVLDQLSFHAIEALSGSDTPVGSCLETNAASPDGGETLEDISVTNMTINARNIADSANVTEYAVLANKKPTGTWSVDYSVTEGTVLNADVNYP